MFSFDYKCRVVWAKAFAALLASGKVFALRSRSEKFHATNIFLLAKHLLDTGFLLSNDDPLVLVQSSDIAHGQYNFHDTAQ